MPDKNRFQEGTRDIVFILRSVWVLVLFFVLIGFLLLATEQGSDVMLCIVEDLSLGLRGCLPALMFLLATCLWAVHAEFCSRFIIYMTDNSGNALSPNHVIRRRRRQRTVSRVFALLPFAINLGAVSLVYFKYLNKRRYYIRPEQANDVLWAEVFLVLAFLACAILFYWLYWRRGISTIASRYPRLHWMRLDAIERQWTRKLSGIYSDFRITLSRKVLGGIQLPVPGPQELPMGVTLPDGSRIPKPKDRPGFEPCARNYYPVTVPNHPDLLAWMYRARLGFFRSLHRQFFLLNVLAWSLILVFALLMLSRHFILIGTPAVVCFGAACWTVVYTFLHFLDRIKSRWRIPVPIRFLLLLSFLASSFWNKDHPVRKMHNDPTPINIQRPLLSQHFGSWLQQLQADSIHYQLDSGKIPVVFIAAEGGALRTGAFTALTLSKLSDRFPHFSKHIYCFSSVSGGSVGSNVFYALTRLKGMPRHQQQRLSPAAMQFFGKDYLAPVVGRLLFGEIINYYLPVPLPKFDRARALEFGWEQEWNKIQGTGRDTISILSGPYFDNFLGTDTYPALFTNTTEVETGRQAIWSNVDINELPEGRLRDVFGRYRFNLRYSTATSLSARFPLVSPAAAFNTCDCTENPYQRSMHYVDGGYYENKGAETMYQVLEALKRTAPESFSRIKPYVIQFNYSTLDSETSPVRAFNELSEPLIGIVNTRGGRGRMAEYYLKRMVDSLGGVYIPVYNPNGGDEVPNSWIMSELACTRMDSLTGNMLYRPTILYQNRRGTEVKLENQLLQRLFVFYQAPLRRQ